MVVDFKNNKIVISLREGESIANITAAVPHTRDEVGNYLFEPYFFKNINTGLAGMKIEKTAEISKVAPMLKQALFIKKGIVRSAFVENYVPVPIIDVQKVTKFFAKSASNTDSFKEGKWDGYIHLYDKKTKTFPTGLIDDVIGALEKRQIPVVVVDRQQAKNAPQQIWEVIDGITPDYDQVQAINAAIEHGRGIIKAPTAFGKTAVLSKRIIAALGKPALFIANKKTLLDDAQKEFSTIFNEKGEPVTCLPIKDGMFGRVKSGKDADYTGALEGADIIVATVQSVAARLADPRTKGMMTRWLREVCDVMIVDEAQVLGTKIWDEVSNNCLAINRFGISATPKRTDGATLKLMATTGPIIFSTTAEEQIKKGRLCDLDIIYKIYDHKLYNEDDEGADYNEHYTSFIVENRARNKMIVDSAVELMNEGRYVLILIQRIEHGDTIKNMLYEAGVPVEDVRFVWGQTADKMRRIAIEDFRKGNFKIMVGSTIFDAGANIPIISGVVLAGAGNSDITLVQRIGRGARNYDYGNNLPEFVINSGGRKVTKVIDFIDQNIRFFSKQSRHRYQQARAEFGKTRVSVYGGAKDAFKSKPKKSAEEKIGDDVVSKLKQSIFDSFGDNTMSEVLDKLNNMEE